MFTAIRSLGQVYGAEIWLVGFLACAAVYFIGNSLWKKNRTKDRQKLLWGSILAAEVLCDMMWKWIYYPQGEYVNRGIGGVAGLLIWPAILILFSGILYYCKYDT